MDRVRNKTRKRRADEDVTRLRTPVGVSDSGRHSGSSCCCPSWKYTEGEKTLGEESLEGFHLSSVEQDLFRHFLGIERDGKDTVVARCLGKL